MAMVFSPWKKFGLLRGARQEMLPTGKAARFGRGPVPPGPLADTLSPQRMQLMWPICPRYTMLHERSPEEGIGASPHGA